MTVKSLLGGAALAFALALAPSTTLGLSPVLPSIETLKTYLQEIDQERITLHLARKYRQPETNVRRIVAASFAVAEEFEVPPTLILAMIRQESSLRPNARSSFGAMGLMQVVPRFHREKLARYGLEEADLFVVEHNIRIGATVLTEYLRRRGGNLERALAKYSGNARNYAYRVARFERELRSLLVTKGPHLPRLTPQERQDT